MTLPPNMPSPRRGNTTSGAERKGQIGRPRVHPEGVPTVRQLVVMSEPHFAAAYMLGRGSASIGFATMAAEYLKERPDLFPESRTAAEGAVRRQKAIEFEEKREARVLAAKAAQARHRLRKAQARVDYIVAQSVPAKVAAAAAARDAAARAESNPDPDDSALDTDWDDLVPASTRHGSDE